MGFGQLTGLLRIEQSERSRNINRQILFSFLAKGIAMLISLVQVPLLFKHLGNESYGIWLTILSVVSWLSLSDIGIGNGLRNRVAESLALNNQSAAKEYVSTAYLCLGSIILTVLVLCLAVIPFLDWQSIFNTSKSLSNNTLRITLSWIVASTLLGFILALVNQVLNAIQQNSLTAWPNIIFGSLFIGSIYLFPGFINGDLGAVAFTYSTLYIVSFLGFSIFIYKTWPYLTPSAKLFKRRHVKSILNIGLNFFIIQVAAIIIFSTSNFIITRLFGPAHVTYFNITFRVFNMISIILAMVMTPLWSAYTEAYLKKDYSWIRGRLRLLNTLIVPVFVVIVGTILFFDQIVEFWMKTKIETPAYLPLLMGIYTLITIWNNIYAYFLNGISRTKEQLVTSIIAMVLNLPLAVFLGKYMEMGVNGVVLASVISLAFFAFVGPITSYKILRKHEQ
ncbi:lipopolysaccharide biosynthesis protein [Dyadobacter fermentans]|uniref:Polysaccharide biosynthesis protein n=1 Tax=Dyadobacter fermentans (strain ATCC 700827 / DSM 18053 / CIP 107007 / KCTC 52180 / NS114) TaxID=471854 RepID=C6W3V1_DYAFD|nr:oligosaccharide flippase family protein [Dyadobacter fermentans]ACT95799.1 polysaccharide biosynthesis protein [Dyadobacter fermentans DSM 18053]